MNKSAFFNNGLMKRRYSVPETVMRKHKLQGSLLKTRSAETTTSGTHNPPKESDHREVEDNEMNVRDESCQTDECVNYANRFKFNNSLRKSLKCRRRDSLRYFKKSNSYCQYRSLIMLHKRMLNKHKELNSLSAERESTVDEFVDKDSVCRSEDPGLSFDERPKDASREVYRDNCVTKDKNSLKKSNSDKHVSLAKKLSPVVRQRSYSPSFGNEVSKSCSADHLNRVLVKPKIIFGEDENSKMKNSMEGFVPRKTFVDCGGKSLDQNTSGYNTVNGSLDDTPRQKSPETPKLISTVNAGAAKNDTNEKSRSAQSGTRNAKKSPDPAFPITFHSESVFVHPYENGFLSHKELHHISIRVVPTNDSTCCDSARATDSTVDNSETKMNVNESDVDRVRNKNKKTISGGDREGIPKSKLVPRDEASGAESEQESAYHETSNDDVANYIKKRLAYDNSDCSVPVRDYPLGAAGGAQSKLKIEVDVTDVNLSNSLHNVLLGQSAKRANEYLPRAAKEADTSHLSYATNDKYKSKAALNYLFQKLGDTYPKRCLLKQPSFHDGDSRYGQYYSELPKIERATKIPQTVFFNNQTYDILSDSLLPGEWSTARSSKYEHNGALYVSDPSSAMKKISGDEHLSDSDISIPDSLEDFQHRTSTPKPNKYEKYDEKLTRGDICGMRPNIIKPKRCSQSISYFINLGESNASKTKAMPATLRERLGKRSRSISKHSSCVEVRKKSPKSAKLIHKQIQTCLNADNSLRKRRKRAITVSGIHKANDEAAAINPRREPKDADLDERIMHILLSGLRMQESDDKKVDAPTPQHRNTMSQSVQTESPNQSYEESPTISEYVEVFKMSSPADGTNGTPNGFYNEETDHTTFSPQELSSSIPAENNLYEVTMSEEIGKINSTNYYRSIKKSKRIYYPTKMVEKRCSSGHNAVTEQTSSNSMQNQNDPSFFKYQKKLKEFKQQMRRQNFDKINANNFASVNDSSSLNFNNNFANENADFLALQYTRLQDKNKPKNQIVKVPGSRNHRFYQRFEAIPEEMSNSSEAADHIQNAMDTINGEQESITVGLNDSSAYNEETDKDECDINQNEAALAKIEADSNENYKVEKLRSKGDDNVEDTQNNNNVNYNQKQGKTDEYKDKLKSQKGKDSLSIVREQEELITLSRGWINFYLLNGNNTEDNITEKTDEENIALSETFHIPHQYMVHVQATPESLNEHMPKPTTTLPGLCKYSKNRLYKPNKVKHIDETILPDIGNMSSSCPKIITTGNTKNRSLRNSLPKLYLSGKEYDVCSRKSEDNNFQIESTTEPVSTPHDVVQTEKSSSVILSSNHSTHSSMEDISERNDGNIKKTPRFQRPHTYHSARNNRWMLTIEGGHNTFEKGASSEVEMQLSLKNNREVSSNHSWKFTVKNEDEDVCLPHLNVNYKMLPFPIYQDENTNTNYSENNSRSNSALSFNEKKNAHKSCSSNLSHHTRRVNGCDTKLQIRRTDNDFTIRGSAITPERKPRVPTMSERDLTRMRLIKPTNSENNLI